MSTNGLSGDQIQGITGRRVGQQDKKGRKPTTNIIKEVTIVGSLSLFPLAKFGTEFWNRQLGVVAPERRGSRVIYPPIPGVQWLRATPRS